MNVEELTNRINKKEEQLKKIEKRIAKWSSGLSQEHIEASKNLTFIQLRTYIADNNVPESDDYNKGPNIQELKRAFIDKDEAVETLNKYKNALLIAKEKENVPVVEIFKEFFANWKEEILKFTLQLYEEYSTLDKRYCQLFNSHNDSTKEERATLKRQMRNLRTNSWLSQMLERSKDGFNKYLDKYMEDRYYELINKVTGITGEITDVSNLHVGYDGRINGTIKGKDAKAKIETIIAGGYNTDYIVNVKHGQCLHYRVLVHEIK